MTGAADLSHGTTSTEHCGECCLKDATKKLCERVSATDQGHEACVVCRAITTQRDNKPNAHRAGARIVSKINQNDCTLHDVPLRHCWHSRSERRGPAESNMSGAHVQSTRRLMQLCRFRPEKHLRVADNLPRTASCPCVLTVLHHFHSDVACSRVHFVGAFPRTLCHSLSYHRRCHTPSATCSSAVFAPPLQMSELSKNHTQCR